MIGSFLAIVFLAASAFVVAMNWVCLLMTQRNHRIGVKRHYSMVPIVPQLLALLAWLLYEPGAIQGLRPIVFVLVALDDVLLWNLALYPLWASRQSNRRE